MPHNETLQEGVNPPYRDTAVKTCGGGDGFAVGVTVVCARDLGVKRGGRCRANRPPCTEAGLGGTCGSRPRKHAPH